MSDPFAPLKEGTERQERSAEDWEWSRSHIADAIDHDGTFLDVGCANGYLIECLPQWTSFDVEPYGLDISAELVALARQRLPEWHDRFWVGNALSRTTEQRHLRRRSVSRA